MKVYTIRSGPDRLFEPDTGSPWYSPKLKEAKEIVDLLNYNLRGQKFEVEETTLESFAN